MSDMYYRGIYLILSLLCYSHMIGQEHMTIMGADLDRFPLVGLSLPELSFDEYPWNRSEDWQVWDNDSLMNVLSIHRGQVPDLRPIKVALVVDHSNSWEMKGIQSEHWIPALQKSLDLFRPGIDSVVLIGYSGEVDMTSDLSDNLEILKLILSQAEVGEGQALEEALQVAQEILAPYSGPRRIVFLAAQNNSDPSLWPLPDIPVIGLVHTEMESSLLQYAAFKNDARLLSFSDSTSLLEGVDQLGQEIYRSAGIQLRYEALRQQDSLHQVLVQWKPIDSVQRYFSGQFREPAKLPEISEAAAPKLTKQWADYLWILGLAGAILIGFFLIRYLRLRTPANLVQPAITQIKADYRNKKITVYVNIPLRKQPGRVTLYNFQGTPVRDFVFPGTRRKISLDISGLHEGLYQAQLTNGGMNSEMRELEVKRE